MNLIVVGLNSIFNRDLAMHLAERLDKLFLDLGELIEYNMVDKEEVLKRCGKEYFEREQLKVFREAMNYENIVISMDYDIFINHIKFIKGKIIYLHFDKDFFFRKIDGSEIINQIAYDDRDIILKERSSMIVNCTDNLKHSLEETIKLLKETGNV